MMRFLTMLFLIAPVACTQTTTNFVEVELEDCSPPGVCPDPAEACVEDVDCESGAYCNTGGTCVVPDCGNGVLEPGEWCDDGNTDNNDSCLAWCVVATCGDGFTRDGVEECDQGAANSDEGACLSDCTEATCGDGFAWTGMEACDDGNNVDSDGCSNTCTLADCGNGVVEGGEQCDDGNGVNDDACLVGCVEATCGDGFTRTGVEACDLGAANASHGSCLPNCAMAICGDGFTWTGVEECDDGNSINNDGCNNDCTATVCGDGIVDALHEDCDDANNVNGDGCDNNCTFSVCGNGIVAGAEQCDDGNLSNNDACLDTCVPATCGDAYVWSGQEECDEGTNNSNTGDCLVNCHAASCGDGNIWAGQEECDDANPVNGDGCDNNCTVTACGNGIITPPEECDDGVNNSNGNMCLASCIVAICGDGFVLQGVEACDDGNSDPNDGCDNSCMINLCGNGVLDPGEGCDPSVPGWVSPPNGMCVDCMLECPPDRGDCNGDPGDGCETVVASDSQNCGQCGHDCGPGSCLVAECQPFLVSNTTTESFAVDDSYAYLFHGGLKRRPKDGSGVDELLYAPQTSPGVGDYFVVGVDEQNVYLRYSGDHPCGSSSDCSFGGVCPAGPYPDCTLNDAILSIPKTGGGSATVVVGGVAILPDVVVSPANDEIYYVGANVTQPLQRPFVISTSGGTATAISPPPPLTYGFSHLALSDNHAYWVLHSLWAIFFGGGDEHFERAALGSSTPERLFSRPHSTIHDMVHGGDGFLYLGRNDLMRMPENGGPPELVVSGALAGGGTSAFQVLAVIEGRLFARRATGQLVEVHLGSPGTLSPLVFIGPSDELHGDGDGFLYFRTGTSSARIRGLRLPPTSP